eukprot:gene7186-5048_t
MYRHLSQLEILSGNRAFYSRTVHFKPRFITILTGAGVSAESGVPTFRDGNGLWCNHRVEDVATPEAFERNPSLVQRFYNERRKNIQDPNVQPNRAHLAISKLQRDYSHGKVFLVTQNVDDLHERAGSSEVVHMHGELLKAQCTRTGKVVEWKRDIQLGVDKCPCCSEINTLRPHIVWFGEMPLFMEQIYEALDQTDLFLSCGTSGNVYPAAGFATIAQANKAKTVEINAEQGSNATMFDNHIYGITFFVVFLAVTSLTPLLFFDYFSHISCGMFFSFSSVIFLYPFPLKREGYLLRFIETIKVTLLRSTMPFEFNVQSTAGPRITITTLGATNTVLDIKRAIEEMEGIPTSMILLVFKGRKLEESSTLADCGVVASSTINMSSLDNSNTGQFSQSLKKGGGSQHLSYVSFVSLFFVIERESCFSLSLYYSVFKCVALSFSCWIFGLVLSYVRRRMAQPPPYYNAVRTSDDSAVNPVGINDEADKKQDQAIFLRTVEAFKNYKTQASAARAVRQKNFQKLQNKHRLLLSMNMDEVFAKYSECIEKNTEFIEDICESSGELFSTYWPDASPEAIPKEPPSENDMNKVFSTLRQFVRDWSLEGKPERDCVYQPILETLERCFPDRNNRSSIRVLIPGAGLCRLSVELAIRGFFAEANEFSYHMLIAASYIQNYVEYSGQYHIFPYCDVTCNLVDRSDQFAEVAIPDLCAYEAIAELEKQNLRFGELSMVAGEFTEVYSKTHQKKKWSAVATCFFIDTAQNIIEYLEIIYDLLQPGGYWVNVGPLLYHFADSFDSMSIELSLKEVLAVAEHIALTAHNVVVSSIEPYGRDILAQKSPSGIYDNLVDRIRKHYLLESSRDNSSLSCYFHSNWPPQLFSSLVLSLPSESFRTFHIMEDSTSKGKKNVKFMQTEEGGNKDVDDCKSIPPFELTKEDVAAAFKFFDFNKTGVLTTSSLKDRLSAFLPNLTSKEYRFLLESSSLSTTGQSSQESNDFTVDTLWELIDTYQQQFYKPSRGAQSNSSAPNTPKAAAHSMAVASTLEAVSRFDPVKESFHVYDPHGTGSVDVQMLGGIMSRIGHGELSDEELAILVRSADFDQDGRINLDDFRHLVCMKGRFMKNDSEERSRTSLEDRRITDSLDFPVIEEQRVPSKTSRCYTIMSTTIPNESTMQMLSMNPGRIHLLPQTPQLHYLFTLIRNRETERSDFVFYSERIMRLVVEAALCLIPVEPCNVITPTGTVFKGVRPDDHGIMGVSILRAGESMERVLREMCRGIRIGKILVQRNEKSDDKRPDERFNYSKMPKDVDERRVLLLDPMCATGGSAAKAVDILMSEYGVKEQNILFLNLVSAPAGLKRFTSQYPEIQIITAAIDDELNEDKYIVPGLGDFGDRYFGTMDDYRALRPTRHSMPTNQVNNGCGLFRLMRSWPRTLYLLHRLTDELIDSFSYELVTQMTNYFGRELIRMSVLPIPSRDLNSSSPGKLKSNNQNCGDLHPFIEKLKTHLPDGFGIMPVQQVLQHLLSATPEVFKDIDNFMRMSATIIHLNDDVASMWKEKGNEFFKQEKYNESALSYSRGLLNAATDEVVATLLNNRSTAFFKLERYADSCVDAYRCLKLKRDYWKALERRGCALQKLGLIAEGEKDIKSSELKDLTICNSDKELEIILGESLRGMPNMLPPQATVSPVVKIERSAKGRTLVAEQNIKEGVILEETPYAFIGRLESLFSTCSYCLQYKTCLYQGDEFRLAKTKSRGLFCSEECASAAWSFFSTERSNLFFLCCPNDTLLAYRLIHGMEQFPTMSNLKVGDKFDELNNNKITANQLSILEGSFTQELFSSASVGGDETIVAALGIYMNAFSISEAEVMRKAQRQVLMNGIDIKCHLRTPISGETKNTAGSIFSTTTVVVGCGMYAVASLLNHSCDPNCFLSFVGNPQSCSGRVVVKAIKPVNAGDELTISYGGLTRFKVHSKQNRAQLLLQRYGFSCRCDYCVADRDEVVSSSEKEIYVKASDYYQKGCRLIREGNYETAVTVLLQSYEIVMRHICPPPRPPQPMIPTTHQSLALAYFHLNNRDKCFEHLKAALETDIIIHGTDNRVEMIHEYSRLSSVATDTTDKISYCNKSVELLERFYPPSPILSLTISLLKNSCNGGESGEVAQTSS